MMGPHRRLLLALSLLAALGWTGLANPSLAGTRLYEVSDPSGSSRFINLVGLSADGRAVIARSPEDPETWYTDHSGFLWTPRLGPLRLRDPAHPTGHFLPHAISTRPLSVAGLSLEAPLGDEAVWLTPGGRHVLPPSFGPGPARLRPGGRVATAWSPVDSHPERWTPEAGLEDLGFFPGATSMRSLGVSTRGDRLVALAREVLGAGTLFDRCTTIDRLVLWSEDAGYELLAELPEGATREVVVSGDARTVFGKTSLHRGRDVKEGQSTKPWCLFDHLGEFSFVWTAEEGLVEQDALYPALSGTRISAANEDATVLAGWRLREGGGQEIVLWDADRGVRPLVEVVEPDSDLLAHRYSRACRWPAGDLYLSADGRVLAGEVCDGTGVNRAFVAVVPEPSPALLLGFALAALALVRAARPRSGHGCPALPPGADPREGASLLPPFCRSV